MAIREIRSVVATGTNMQQCLSDLTRELRREKIVEDDVITLQYDADDSGISAWAFFWKQID